MNFLLSTIGVMLSANLQQAIDNRTIFLIVLLIMIVVALALIFNARSRNVYSETRHEELPAHEPEAVPEVVSEPDNLRLIEGIGPKIQSLFNDNGIYTFEQLANSSVDTLQEILNEAKLQIANPGTWPKQAKLAADGKMDELAKLQDELKGGKEVS